MPRVAHIVLSMNPGGLESLVCSMAESPVMEGVETFVCCLDEPGVLAKRVEESGARVVTVKRGAGIDPVTPFRIASWLRRERIDAVHTHSLDPMLAGGVAASLAGVPIRIHTQHNVLLGEYGSRDRLKFRIASRLFDRIVSVSEETDRWVAAYGVPPERRAVVINGIDETTFSRSREPVRSDGFVVGTVARLSGEKGVDVLLRAFGAARRPGWRLVVAADGPERERLQGDSDRLGIAPEVTFLGYRGDVPEILRGLDLFVLPSRTEGVPLALLEAMGRGLPVVATAVGGVPEVVEDGVSGRLVPPDDPEALGRAIGALADDPAGRERLSANAARRVAERFTLSRTARAYRFLYDSGRERRRFRQGVNTMILRRLPRSWMTWRGDPASRTVALTFDDAPDPDYTPRLLDILERHGAKATFFLVGKLAERHPDIVRRMVREGHELGNHSYSHPEFGEISLGQAMGEIARTERAIREIQGASGGWFRPPKGKLCLGSLLGAWRHRSTIVMWSSDLKDFRAASADAILDSELACPIRDGDIVLYHGNTAPSLEALPGLIERACRGGRRAVTLTRLFA